jgi:hypothetical protein
MQSIPKIVRERLRTPAVVDHPDADLLTAFAERSLRPLERETVLGHLARCRECREVVALALPPSEAVENGPIRVGAGAAGRRWLTWPALRWGFVAAGIVVVASVGVWRYQHHEELTARYSNPAAERLAEHSAANPAVPSGDSIALSAPAQTVAAATATEPSAGKFDVLQKKESEPAKDRQSFVTSADSARAATAPIGPYRGGLSHGPKLPTQLQQNQASANSPVNNDQIAKQQNPEGANRQPPSAAETVQVQAQSEVVEVAPPGDFYPGKATSVVAEQKPAEPPHASMGGPAVASPSATPAFHPRAQPDVGPLPRWAINANGSLQRSFDHGDTWENVDVTQDRAPASAFANADSAGSLMARTDKEAKAILKQEKGKVDAGTPVFRAVTANGADIWAGGSKGLLYHSMDAGGHWTRVVPSANGTTLTVDIVGMEFVEQKEKITTATSEIWITSDDGQTWQKQ